ncbi:flavin reductase family protein [Achromobacter sp. NFACC18-2]|uniref:flavin reductase family protein n=1 Tax=Achromobacter sp. NFACC18-2 TaxID=1564112 RepID=UPI0008CFA0FB|nr:flavin reductase family protein [Achromobacter sp. NFACC18-2]SEJ11299.1 NADH-FMN oxidoreductase RutF, flavin reductase (DIM6/NTAB) family [Achromobacter sp. NFACC18-2]
MHFPASDLNPEQTYRLMSGIIVPRPIAWISTINANGVVNLAPFSCYTFVSNQPPMVGINIGRKAGERKDTGRNIIENGHFVVNIADETLLDPLHESAQEHPPEISEAELLGLEVLAGEVIATPRLAAAPISLECRLHSVTPFGNTGAEFFVGEVVMFHIRDGLMQDGKIDTGRLRPICRIGGPNYASLGEIITKRGIAQTPKSVMKPEVA